MERGLAVRLITDFKFKLLLQCNERHREHQAYDEYIHVQGSDYESVLQ